MTGVLISVTGYWVWQHTNLPADAWLHAELLQNEIVAQCGLVNHVHVVRGCLVVPVSGVHKARDHSTNVALTAHALERKPHSHAPAAVDKLELAVGNEATDVRLHRRCLLTPPPLEEGLCGMKTPAAAKSQR